MSVLALSRSDDVELPIPGADPWFVSPHDPAVVVMTDFRSTASITVAELAPIDEALEHMKHTGVRCAFAIDERRRVVVGLVTAYDIMGEKPMSHMHSAAMPRSEVLVRHIMQRIAEWKFVRYADLEKATVAEVAALFEDAALTHLPVMASDADGSRRLRGLLSASKVRRLLSAPVPAVALRRAI